MQQSFITRNCKEIQPMVRNNPVKTALYFFLLIATVIGLSILSNKIWVTGSEKITVPEVLVIEDEMTIGRFGQANSLDGQMLKEIFSLETKSGLEKQISEYGSAEQVRSLVVKKTALLKEEADKNWKKIAVKFLLWFVFLMSVFIYLRKHKATPVVRNSLLFISLSVFGVIFGSDPAPMGTVKDAVHLFATARTIFPPRMIALTVFLLMVFLANKYICAWGCQAGTLQDLIFRLNRDKNNKAVIWKQFKLPFVLTNTFRVTFFFVFIFIAFLWGIDIIEPVDFFKIYKPSHLGFIGGTSAGVLILASLFIYRPWCHLFCPFGLTGWVIEKISLVRININYDTCIACKKCADACPSTVMSAILLQDKKTIPDCFACYTCRDVCPSGSIEFSAGKRTKPPADRF